jgi:hypothetical protein
MEARSRAFVISSGAFTLMLTRPASIAAAQLATREEMALHRAYRRAHELLEAIRLCS